MTFLGFSADFASAAPADFTTEVTESKALEALDQAGVKSFATLLGLSEAERVSVVQNQPRRLKLLRLKRFSTQSAFQTIRSTISADVAEFVRNSGLHMTKDVGALAPKDKERPRYFDANWLSSDDAAMKLVAVVNRVDRMDFDPHSCGELRLIYRLGYDKGVQYSVLPVFLNVVYEYPEGNCAEIAKLWRIQRGDFATPGNFANALLQGPLAPERSIVKQIELNMQMVRFSSGDKTDFGGQAIYLLRIWKVNSNGSLEEQPLENMPDVQAIRKDPGLLDNLISQISAPEALSQIDRGVFQLQNTSGRLLAKKAFSFSTTGRARLANKPFTVALGEKGKTSLANLPFSTAEFVKSPKGLTERLNNLSCIGCHQSNGVAGFHMLGRHFELDTKTNRTAVPFSPHFYEERLRRAHYLDQLADGQEPDRFRPHSMFKFDREAPAHLKEICLPPGNDFAQSIHCSDPNTECVRNVRNKALDVEFGECMLKKDFTKLIPAGMSCREGEIVNATKTSSSLPFNFFAFQDHFSKPLPDEHYKLPPEALCGKPRGGIPLGRIRRPCTPESSAGMFAFADELLAAPDTSTEQFTLPAHMCAIRGGSHIDACAATDHVAECLKTAVVPRSMLDLCTVGKFCREDYLCQQLPLEIAKTYKDRHDEDLVLKRITELNRRNIGFCVPNYFVFNMRIDGHPQPND